MGRREGKGGSGKGKGELKEERWEEKEGGGVRGTGEE